MAEPGILVVRDDGVIVVPGAIPLGRGWVVNVEQLLDTAGATPRTYPLPPERREHPK